MTSGNRGEGRRPPPRGCGRTTRRPEKLSVPVTVRLPYSLSLRLRSRVPRDGVSAFIRRAIEELLNSTWPATAGPAADQYAEEHHHDHT